jgi:hypothetical protein
MGMSLSETSFSFTDIFSCGKQKKETKEQEPAGFGIADKIFKKLGFIDPEMEDMDSLTLQNDPTFLTNDDDERTLTTHETTSFKEANDENTLTSFDASTMKEAEPQDEITVSTEGNNADDELTLTTCERHSFEEANDEDTLTSFDAGTVKESGDQDKNTVSTVGNKIKGAEDEQESTVSTSQNSFLCPIEAKIVKTNMRENLGVRFVSFKKKKGIYVYQIYKSSKFLDTDLEAGMKVLFINGESCPESVGAFRLLIKSFKREVVITAVAPRVEEEEKCSEKKRVY